MSYSRNVPTVVIGGGIMGATILYELARRDEPAILFEERAYGQESTGKSAAIVRMHYSNPAVVRMALRSREAFRTLPDTLGCEPLYYETGWLFLVDDADTETAKANRAMQLDQGVDSEEVDLDRLRELVPGIETAGIAYALFEPKSGFADPIATTVAYINAAKRLGAHAHSGAPVERIQVSGERVTGVVVDGQTVGCERVVVAAGAWSKKLAATARVDLPLEFTREQDVVYDTGDSRPVHVAISDQADRIYMRPLVEAGDSMMLVGRGFPKDYELVDPDGYVDTIDDPFEEEVRGRLLARIPRLEGIQMVDGRVGLYSVTPDWHPLIGEAGDVEGLFIATGGSGHCFKLGPAIGEMVVGALVREPVDYADVGLFALDRFERGEELRSTFGGNRA